MRARPKVPAALAVLVVLAALALGAAGCSTEQLALTLGVSAAPNPVTGVEVPGGRRWDYQISITNPHPVGVFVEYYHVSVAQTDTGYEQPLVATDVFALAGRRIAPGGTLSYAARSEAEGRFTRGTERRIYHTRGDDGKFYSGEVLVSLR